MRQLIRQPLALAADLPGDDRRQGEQCGERAEEDERRRSAPRHRVFEPSDEGRERDRQHAGDARDDEHVPERTEHLDRKAQPDEDRQGDDPRSITRTRATIDGRRDARARGVHREQPLRCRS